MACLAGYIWVFISYQIRSSIPENQVDVCLIKKATSIPCPSCGSTRSINSILQGNFIEALLWNPFGFFILAIMVSLPLLLLFDITSKKDLTFQIYQRFETTFKQKKIAIPAFLLVIGNWAWNIYKDV